MIILPIIPRTNMPSRKQRGAATTGDMPPGSDARPATHAIYPYTILGHGIGRVDYPLRKNSRRGRGGTLADNFMSTFLKLLFLSICQELILSWFDSTNLLSVVLEVRGILKECQNTNYI